MREQGSGQFGLSTSAFKSLQSRIHYEQYIRRVECYEYDDSHTSPQIPDADSCDSRHFHTTSHVFALYPQQLVFSRLMTRVHESAMEKLVSARTTHTVPPITAPDPANADTCRGNA